jgi:hypothetical protein
MSMATSNAPTKVIAGSEVISLIYCDKLCNATYAQGGKYEGFVG